MDISDLIEAVIPRLLEITEGSGNVRSDGSSNIVRLEDEGYIQFCDCRKSLVVALLMTGSDDLNNVHTIDTLLFFEPTHTVEEIVEEIVARFHLEG